ncbi:MAG TPA: TonB-dependent receptor plug domain-containing protein, partial [Bacteroidales bacterium]|nr:TonB-dependent receptor plug domain-containing protein [Bacteroidales bacterium]
MVTSKQINIAALLLFFLSIVVQTSGQNILDSVVINADKVRVGSLIYTPDKSKIVVSVTGEQDILKYISKLPGVSSGIEGSSSMFVRGGNNGNNKIMLDGVPFYD